MITDPNESVVPIVQTTGYPFSKNSIYNEPSENMCIGLTKREHIMIEMHKAMIIGLFASTPKGDFHGHSYEEIASQALLHTDAIINALNDNP